ncbi:MAG: DUF1232 domain-containing protein [Myxococcota bacterium]
MAAGSQVTIELNPKERRLYDRLRAFVIVREPGDSSGLRDLLLLLPDLTVLLARLLRDPRVPLRAKLVALAGMGYVVWPLDLLPAFLFGPLGLVDDLVVVGATLSRLLNHVHPDVVRSQWPGKGDALDAVTRVTAWTERQLSARIQGLLALLRRRRPAAS